MIASAISAYNYKKAGNLDIKNSWVMLVAVLVMTVVGSFVATFVPEQTMNGTMQVVMIIVGLRFILKPITTPKEKLGQQSKRQRNTKAIIGGSFVGFICGFVGAGGNNPRAQTDNETMTPDLDGVKDFFALEESGLKFVFDLNITSAFLVTQVFAQDMVKTGGNIINISSMSAFRPLTKIPAYSAAKAGISNFTQWLAVHFAPCNIRCNAIAPGFFVTNQNRSLLFNEDGTPTARTGKILAATPMKKFGEISDLIGTLMWLADDNASGFVTGTVIPVDGGFSAYSGV